MALCTPTAHTGVFCFFFNDTATTEIYTLSLQRRSSDLYGRRQRPRGGALRGAAPGASAPPARERELLPRDRKSTRLNSSHSQISYAVFCLKKKEAIHPWTLASPECVALLARILHSHGPR